MKSLQGQFLVASPHLSDDNFFRSIVFMIQHDEEGALGVVLNRPTNNTLREVWEHVDPSVSAPPLPIYLGGPVPGPLLALHRDPSVAESEVLPGVWLTSEQEKFRELLLCVPSPIRVFHGYSGWAAGQLEAELEVGGWLTTPASADELFHEKDDLWECVVRRIGLEILVPGLRPDQVPDDPSLN